MRGQYTWGQLKVLNRFKVTNLFLYLNFQTSSDVYVYIGKNQSVFIGNDLA